MSTLCALTPKVMPVDAEDDLLPMNDTQRGKLMGTGPCSSFLAMIPSYTMSSREMASMVNRTSESA